MLIDSILGAHVYDLEQPRDHRSPIHPGHVPPGYQYVLHRRHEPGLPERRTSAAGVITTSEHAGTHIDAFCHQAEDLKLYGGRAVDARLQTAFGFTEQGADSIAPIVARGVLIDLARHLGHAVEPARWIQADEVREAAAAQGVEPRRGDVVLVRTGNGTLWGSPAEYLRGAGFDSLVSQWLADVGVRAVGADNMAWDWIEGVDGYVGTSLPGHVIFLVRHGIHIIENLFLEDLGAAEAREFLFVCLPLKLRGATGSPVRPVAIVPAS
jgi:kynurenine formamidase